MSARALRAGAPAVAGAARPRPLQAHQRRPRPPGRRHRAARGRPPAARPARATATLVARIGGEEFAWLLPGADEMDAWQAAERARLAVASRRPRPGHRRLTISAGVCELGQAGAPMRAAAAGRRRPLLGEGPRPRPRASATRPTWSRSSPTRSAPPASSASRRSAPSGRWPARWTPRTRTRMRHSRARRRDGRAAGARAGLERRPACACCTRRRLLHDVGKIARARRGALQAGPAHRGGVRARPRARRAAGREIVADVLIARAGGVGARPPRALRRRAATRTASPARTSPTAPGSWRSPTPGTP